MVVCQASHTHPGFDSGLEICRSAGDVLMGHGSEHTGCDIFGKSPLCIFTGDGDVMYTFGWRWSESGQRNILGWWYGPSEWDVANIQRYGPVQA